MAYIVDYALTESTAGATSFALNVPDHDIGDVLLAIVSADATGTFTMSGWTQIGTQQTANSAIRTAAFWIRATTTTTTATLGMGTADAVVACILDIKDVDATTAIDAFVANNSGTTTASQITSSSVTTTTSDCLLIYALGLDGIANTPLTNPGNSHFVVAHDSGGTTATTSAAQGVAWYVQRTAGASPTPGWTAPLAGVYTRFTIALRNAAGGRVPAYVDDSSLCGTVLTQGHHFSTLNGISFPTALDIANIGPAGTGKTTVYDAAAATGDYGLNPYSSALATTPATTAATSASGFQITFTANQDLSTDFVVGSVIASTPKIANYTHGSVKQGGSYLAVADASNRYHSFQILGRDSSPNTEGRAVFSVQPNQTTTRYGYSTAAYTPTTTTKLFFLSNCPVGTITLYVAELHRARKHIAAGGTSTFPVDSEGLSQIGRSFRINLIQKTGAAGLLSYIPLQIGGGDSIYFNIDAGSLQFPALYNIDTKQINYHAAPNAIGISYAGKSGDTIFHTNSVVTSASPFYWEINAAATSAAAWDFTGLTVVNANVTLRNVTTFDSMSFSNCLSLSALSCTITNSNISIDSTTANAMVLNSSSVISNCDINTTGISSGIALTQVTTPSIFSNCTFVGSGTSGHAIQITTPGTYTFTGNVFNGYGATGSNSAAIYNNSGGTVVINVSGGGSVPSYRNGAGATTTINAAANVTLTGLKPDSEVRAYLGTNPATATELGGVESSTTSFTFSQAVAGQAGYIQIFHVEYQPVFLNVIYSSLDVDIPIQQIADRQYTRGSVNTPG